MTGRALVIGAGPNGLVAAIKLASAGLETTVLEACSAPGGAVRTEPLTLPGFRHDTFSSVYPAGAASAALGRLPLAQHGLEWIHPEICMVHPLADGSAVALHHELELTVASLEAQASGDGRSWARFVGPYLRNFEAVRDSMLTNFPPVSGPLRLLAGAGPAALAGLGLLPALPATLLAQRLFSSAGARGWLLGGAAHGDVPVTRAGSALPAFYLSLLGHAVGWPSPRGGAQSLTDALVGYLRSLGGELICSAPVERITSVAGRVTGVATVHGRRYVAETVLADLMPQALVAMSGDALKGWYRACLVRFQHGPATVKLDWALDGPIPWMAPAARAAGTIHLAGDATATVNSLTEAATGLPEAPFLLLGQQSVADPTRAPAGKHTAWAYTRAAPHLASDLASESMIDAIERQVERYAPGFRSRILARHVLGPAELEARNPNLVRGDVGGGSYRRLQALFRPLPALSPYRTPVEGLYLASAAAFPGGGVHGVPGEAAARAALAALRRTGRR